ncbi:MAG TPA: transglycosylase SLT domain-containing protein [Burkholderiaceae bacterium]|nr:transglycosylase SLT domain-containing protein [Burkholderiaceae bacterium]
MLRAHGLFMCLLLAFTLAGCGKKAPEPTEAAAPTSAAQAPAPSSASPGSQASIAAQSSATEPATATGAGPAATAAAAGDDVRALSLANKPWKGDFNQMLERKLIRILVPHSRTLYFNDKGQERGLTAVTVRDFEAWINKKYRKDKRPVTVFMIVTTRDQLLPGVADGRGDIAAGNITVTGSRLKIVDFYSPDDQKLHAELVVAGPGVPALASVEDLSGKTVSVRPSSSFYESLIALNQRLAGMNKRPVTIQKLPDALEDEDILEMVNAGILGITVVDDWEANLWATVLPSIKVYPDLAVRSGAKIGWAIRKGSPELAAAIEDFRENYLVKQGVMAYRLAMAEKRFKQIHNPTKGEDEKRFEDQKALFFKYGEKYGFDPVMLAAQGYQESRLDQNAKSHVGAVGVMQLMPATGKELGVGDIRKVEPNIHAGAKYMDQLMEKYFKDAKFDEQNRTLFAFASYNAGPGRIQQMRKLAASRGLNPDVWFNNVEIVTAEKVGMETTTYVRNIYKYYAAYKLGIAAKEKQRAAAQQVAPTTKP